MACFRTPCPRILLLFDLHSAKSLCTHLVGDGRLCLPPIDSMGAEFCERNYRMSLARTQAETDSGQDIKSLGFCVLITKYLMIS
jgi:hypothetical protein